MKLLTLAAAGLVAVTGMVPALTAPAAAQHRVVVRERTVVRHVPRERHYRYRQRTRCHYERHHGHRERVCRTVYR